MIPNLDNLIELFHKMQTDGFDTNSPLKWGFYFVDTDKEKLKRVFLEQEINIIQTARIRITIFFSDIV